MTPLNRGGRTAQWGFRKRCVIAYASMIPLTMLLVAVDVFVWHWMPWAFWVVVVLWAAWLLPWMMEGKTWRALWRDHR